MRYFFACFTLYLLSISVPTQSYAQISLTINDIAKIHFIDGAGYLGGYYRNEYDLLPENGQWKTYQTHESYSRYNRHRGNPKDLFEKKDSSEYKFIRNLPADSIDLFLKTLRVIKPKFDPAALHISIPQLTVQVDTQLKSMDKKHLQIFNSFFDTPAKLYHLLDTLQYDVWTDDSPYSVMEIIRKNRDTIKVYTTRQVDYMLPWTVNGVSSYDININHFFMAAIGVSDHRMSGRSISYHIREWVDFLYARNAFERLRWQETAPQTLIYIEKHFVIVNVNQWNDYTSFTFQPKALNKRIIIGGTLNFNDQDELARLTRFAEDTLKQFMKNGGFMIDSCMHKNGCTIHFANNHGHSLHDYFSINQNSVDTYLSKYDRKQLVPFSIFAGERIEDNWVALPDGNFLLIAYLDHYAVGVSPQYIDQTRTGQRWFVLKLFSGDGKLIEEKN